MPIIVCVWCVCAVWLHNWIAFDRMGSFVCQTCLLAYTCSECKRHGVEHLSELILAMLMENMRLL